MNEVPPFQQTSATSRMAAENLAPQFKTLKDRVEHHIREAGEDGKTREELSFDLGVKEGTICGAVNSLQREGRVHVASFRRRSSLDNEVEVLLALVKAGTTQFAMFGLEKSTRQYH